MTAKIDEAIGWLVGTPRTGDPQSMSEEESEADHPVLVSELQEWETVHQDSHSAFLQTTCNFEEEVAVLLNARALCVLDRPIWLMRFDLSSRMLIRR